MEALPSAYTLGHPLGTCWATVYHKWNQDIQDLAIASPAASAEAYICRFALKPNLDRDPVAGHLRKLRSSQVFKSPGAGDRTSARVVVAVQPVPHGPLAGPGCSHVRPLIDRGL